MPSTPTSTSPAGSAPDAATPTPETGGHRSVLSLLRDLQQGVENIESLTLDDRRSCVAHLSGQGLSAPEIAEALRLHERTVYRDLAAIRRANALSRPPSPSPAADVHMWACTAAPGKVMARRSDEFPQIKALP